MGPITTHLSFHEFAGINQSLSDLVKGVSSSSRCRLRFALHAPSLVTIAFFPPCFICIKNDNIVILNQRGFFHEIQNFFVLLTQVFGIRTYMVGGRKISFRKCIIVNTSFVLPKLDHFLASGSKKNLQPLYVHELFY